MHTLLDFAFIHACLHSLSHWMFTGCLFVPGSRLGSRDATVRGPLCPAELISLSALEKVRRVGTGQTVPVPV